MNIDPTLLQLLVLLVSAIGSALIGFVLKRIGDIARDVAEIRKDVGEHTAELAKGEARIDQLRSDVDGLLERERARLAG